ncbi:DUF5107 domain-containing protein [Lactiplantibacillus paraplantarum]|uniref:DUF5107 domain-containing protein n=1 Tax=Lactiplantibacillus paraplantarum TaxID=60520 RepID=UPI0005132AB2|nr:DUF5107 domain-containing protein [Lactiplantibacillus paraplantarum]ALO05379.1 hypothetical protein ASU28_13985 [Lactiplantibacillus paraplantarum]KGE74768.1 hypothetical protein HR47_11165 [Lactiplantibacillus paraplantarum]MCW1911619.1 DUF5107 domain-containing protein [Lactiplantibacillus paraplantarum]OAX74770.1 hypothetical protein A0U96_07290 [Lactiplantibacillus plantarum]
MLNTITGVSLTETKLTIPTYQTSKPEKNPMFLEKRVYQGSSGKVYPFPVTEKILDKKVDQEYHAVILENQYLQITFLPELGGRIYRALDKTNNYDFVYYNHVIKPALVGLTGSWISGGIEFNWPQHHRPDTFLPIEYRVEEHDDGAKTLWMSDTDAMYGTKVTVGFTLTPDKAYLKLDEYFKNPTDIPQTFLWWANPAVPVNDHTQSIFPPDVTAVFDHGKRAVSTFPIATGEYYKMDYSAGVDISRYKNVPVPTSYMAAHSEYDFLGNYDHQKHAGLLHVADHHTSPGKKQWTWGNGDFGKSWDYQLTDNDGPYIELMVGTFTDNQPDFTWLKPHEEKSSTEYFMPYQHVGAVKNATKDAVLNFKKVDQGYELIVYTTSEFRGAHIKLMHQETVISDDVVTIKPTQVFSKIYGDLSVPDDELKIIVTDADGKFLVTYQQAPSKIEKIPAPAKAIKEPSQIQTNDELLLAARHLEQYRHATYRPDDYYLEALKRDPMDERVNDAYGLLLYRRGLFSQSERYFRAAIARENVHNTNPLSGSAQYHLGLSLLKQDKLRVAYDHFYKATWSYETQSSGFLALARIKSGAGDLEKTLAFLDKAILTNYHDMTIRTLKSNVLRRLGRLKEAEQLTVENERINCLDAGNLYEKYCLHSNEHNNQLLKQALNNNLNDYLSLAEQYMDAGQFEDAMKIVSCFEGHNPMKYYYQSYLATKLGNLSDAKQYANAGAIASPDYIFPNRLMDIKVLEYVIDQYPDDGLAAYYLGNLFYDRKVYERATQLWKLCTKLKPEYAMAHRNLAIAYFNKQHQQQAALKELETAFELDPQNSRLVFELDTLYEKLAYQLKERITFLERHMDLVKLRDDSYISLVTLLNETGQYQRAYDLIMAHTFHPWEGGEGKVSTQYEYALVELAKKDLVALQPQQAIEKLQQALTYPRSLGEGKLPIAVNNVIDYYLGLAYKQVQDEAQAKAHFISATQGLDEPTDMMYYNDQPADTIFYQGLAYEQLQQADDARAKYYKLINFGEQHLFDEFKMDYFAVSLPDALLFDENYQTRNTVHCYYLMALGYVGLGKLEKAQKLFKQASTLNNHHQGVIRHQNFVKTE